MLFNSLSFAIFLPIVFLLYWKLSGKLKLQNLLLLAASLFFYACWDWRFLLLLVFSIGVDYFVGIKLSDASSEKWRKVWMWTGVSVSIGMLLTFKYFNFFSESFGSALQHLGLHASTITLNLVLPLGISFYTFHELSYILDIYNKKITAERNLVNYAVFITFFPLLVAGPIERATHLLPQIANERQFNRSKAVDGLKQILWGLFKKIVIADQCAIYSDMVFANSDAYSGSTLLLGAILFSFQVYGDFSGYSDIALGTARLFGIELLKNFSFPFFSRNMAEFWRRWHISLSSWFRDYVYKLLGGSREGKWKTVRNILIVFFISGLWHGANWTYVTWGVLHGVLVLPMALWGKKKTMTDVVAQGKLLPSFNEAMAVLGTFLLSALMRVIFRSTSLTQATDIFRDIFSSSLFTIPYNIPGKLSLLLIFFFATEWMGREKNHALEDFALKVPRPVRWSTYYTIVILIIYFNIDGNQFIYFQF